MGWPESKPAVKKFWTIRTKGDGRSPKILLLEGIVILADILGKRLYFVIGGFRSEVVSVFYRDPCLWSSEFGAVTATSLLRRFFWSFLFLTLSLARISITCNQHHIFVDGALDSLAECCLPWNKRPSPLVRIARFFFFTAGFDSALRLRNISTKVASVKNDAWSMFHSLRCIMGASPVNYVPATSLKT